jgi:hypothetical protein
VANVVRNERTSKGRSVFVPLWSSGHVIRAVGTVRTLARVFVSSSSPDFMSRPPLPRVFFLVLARHRRLDADGRVRSVGTDADAAVLLQGDDLLRTVGPRSDHHECREPLVLETDAQVDAVDPDVDVVAILERARHALYSSCQTDTSLVIALGDSPATR